MEYSLLLRGRVDFRAYLYDASHLAGISAAKESVETSEEHRNELLDKIRASLYVVLHR